MNKSNLFIILILILWHSNAASFAYIEDEFAQKTLAQYKDVKPHIHLEYNYESLEKVPIKLQILKDISTKKNQITDGEPVLFKVQRDVFYDNKIIIKKGTIVKAKVETYLTRGMNGIPAAIIIDNFEIPNIDSNKLKSLYVKKGLSLTPMVLPIKWALTPVPPLGSTTNLIIGGNAKITTKDTITIFYHPDWI